MKKLGVIINPRARGVKKMKVDPQNFFKEITGDIADVRVTNSVEEVDTIAEEYKKGSVPFVAICGGDGTHHHVISRFINVYKGARLPSFLHLRAGTMNTACRTINLKGKPRQILKKMAHALEQGLEIKIMERKTIKVGDKYCFIFGTGMTANFLYEYYRGEGTGPVKAVKTIWLAIKGALFGADVGTLFDRVNAKVQIDGKEVPHDDFLAILCATVDDIGIGFKPLYRAYERDNTFHVLSVGSDVGLIVKNLWKVRVGKPIRHPLIFDDIAQKLVITSSGKMLYTMDGDLYESEKKLMAEAGPAIGMVYI